MDCCVIMIAPMYCSSLAPCYNVYRYSLDQFVVIPPSTGPSDKRWMRQNGSKQLYLAEFPFVLLDRGNLTKYHSWDGRDPSP